MALLTNCPQCRAELATDGLDESTEARCSGCGAQFVLDGLDAGLSTKNTKATWSAVLGSVSFLGLILTGIPAVILGWLALKDIKSRKTSTGRRRALAGMVLGSVFGLGCGCGVGGLAIMIPQIRPFKDPVAIQAVIDKIGRPELPEQVEPKVCQQVFGMKQVTYQDPGNTSTIVSMYYPFAMAQTESMAFGQASSLRTGMKLSPHKTHKVKGVARPLDVGEQRGTRDGEAVQVWTAAMKHPLGWVVMQVMVKKDRDPQGKQDAEKNPRYEMTLDEVLRAFASYKVPAE